MTRILFIGAGHLTAPLFQGLQNTLKKHPQYELVGIVTQPDKPAGRRKKLTPCPFKRYLNEQSFPYHLAPSNPNQTITPSNKRKQTLPLFSPTKLRIASSSILLDTQPDLIIVVDYGQMIPQDMLTKPQHKCLNIHHSLLPDLRGATPVQTALLKGYTTTGTTLQIMEKELDSGDILAQRQQKISQNDNFLTLGQSLSHLASQMIQKQIPKYIKGEISPQKQEPQKITFCKQSDFSKKNAQINWDKDAQDIHNHVRAFFPHPVAWTYFDEGKRLKILKTRTSSPPQKNNINSIKNPPGTLFADNKRLYITTAKGNIEITLLQAAGKQPQKAHDFINGYSQKLPLQLPNSPQEKSY